MYHVKMAAHIYIKLVFGIYDTLSYIGTYLLSGILVIICYAFYLLTKIVSEYDQEIPQSQTANIFYVFSIIVLYHFTWLYVQ